MGRLFDALSALVGLRGTINYEGQAAEGKTDEALSVHRERLALQRSRFPRGSKDVNGSIMVCALALLQRGTLNTVKEAEPLLRECLDIRLKTMSDDYRVFTAKSLLGEAILTIADLDSALTPDARAARFREAEPLVLDGYAGLKDNSNVPTSAQSSADHKRDALERIARLYEVWDKAEPDRGYDAKAAEWRATLDAAPPTQSPK